MPDSLQSAARALASTLRPAVRSLGGPDGAVLDFIQTLGWTLPTVPPALRALQRDVADLARAHGELELSVSAGGASVGVRYVAVATKLAVVVDRLHALPAQLAAQVPPGSDVAARLPRRLLDTLVHAQIVEHTERLEPALRLLGLMEVTVEQPGPPRSAFLRRTVRWDRLGALLTDPGAVMRDVHGFGTPAFDGRFLLDQLMHLSFGLGGPAGLDWPTPERVQALTGTLPSPGDVGPPGLTLPLLEFGAASAAVEVLPLPAVAGRPPGLALGAWVRGEVPATVSLRPGLTLELESAPALATGVSIALRPGQPPQARLGLEGSTGAAAGGKRIGARVRYARGEPLVLLAFPDGSRLQAGAVVVAGGLAPTPGGLSPGIEVTLEKARTIIAAGLRDSFLSSLLPAGPLELEADLSLGWTHGHGISLGSGGGLSHTVPLHAQLGPLRADSLTIAGTLRDGALRIEASLTGGGSFGPLDATIERIGVEAAVVFADGNLGPVDVRLVPKAPTGVGLKVDAGVVRGGGYLSLDVDRGEYAGALELDLAGIVSINAIALITTRMPDGTPGFSLLIVLTAEFATGIQLGFGFTLLAVGGIVGLNRGMALEPLLQGVRSGGLGSVMFPRDVVANAPRIISDLRQFFPPRDGTFLIGPMVKLGWGTPTMVSLSVGIILEIPGNVAILGVLKVALPAEDLPVILIQVHFVGAIEFDKKRVFFFAGLFDSRILHITMEGEMALLAAFGDDADFVLSVGGFHPSFRPPPLPVPNPRRIAMDIISTPAAKLRAEAYFAVTTNTAQFGARVDLRFGLEDFGLKGSLALDALVQFSPLHFIVTISASVSLDAFGVGIFSIRLRLELEGPTPWRARGTGSISLLFFDIDVDFSLTWGEERPTALPPVEAMRVVADALAKPESWRAQLPPAANLLVSLRTTGPASSDLVLHPLGALRVSQRAVPLDLTISRVGNQRPSDASRLMLRPRANAALTRRGDVDERFAPAQFQDFDDAAKLSKPAFERMHGGIDLVPAEAKPGTGTAVRRVVRYEEIVIDSAHRRHRRFVLFAYVLFAHLLSGCAAALSQLSAKSAQELQPFDEHIKVSAEAFAVVSQVNNRPVAAAFASQAQASEHLHQQVAANPALAGTLQVVPAFEAVA